MAIVTATNKVMLIDRTLTNISSAGWRELVQLLLTVGADLVEVTEMLMKSIDNTESISYPQQLLTKFIMRVETRASFITAIENGFKYFIIHSSTARELFQDEACPESILGICNDSSKYLVLVELATEGYSLWGPEQEQLQWLEKLYSAGLIQGISWEVPSQLTSQQITQSLTEIKKSFTGQINLCPSNQYELATSGAIAGIAWGTNYVTTSFAGIKDIAYPETPGLAPLEEVLVAAKVNPAWQVEGNLEILPRLTKEVEQLADIKISKTKPIIGADIFNCESGIHVAGLQRDSTTYEPFDPQVVGLKRQLILGKHSGREAVGTKLKELGCTCTSQTITRLVQQVSELSIKQRSAVSEQQLLELFMLNSPQEELKWAHGQ